MELEKVARKLRPLMPEDVDHWMRVWESGNPRLKNLIERKILNEAYRHLGTDFKSKPLLSLPPEEKAKGALHLGTVRYEQEKWPVGLQIPELMQHVGIYGRSGAGKTNLSFHLLRQLTNRGIPWLFLDWKRTARHMLPRMTKPVQIYTPGRKLSPMLFNPFVAPPGLEKHLYINHLIDFFAAAYTLGDGARRLLQKAISTCYSELENWPTVQDVLKELERAEEKGRAGQWKVSALRALESFAFSQMSDTKPADQEALVKQLAQGRTIIELDGLSTNEKKLVVPSLLFWLYSHFLSQQRREELKLVIFVEEAHHVFYRQEQRAKETVIDMVIRQCRELGIGVIIIDQHPHLISSAALGNSFATIGMNMREPSDVNKAGALLGMGEDDKRFLRSLPLGQGVVRLQGRWQEPFLVQFPKVPVRKGETTDEDLVKYLEKPSAALASSLSAATGKDKIWRVPGIPLDDTTLSEASLSFLEDVVLYRQDGVKERYSRLNISARQGTTVKRDLIENGWLDE